MTGWTFADIGKLTMFQICEILWHKRDEDGNLVIASPDGPDPKDAHRAEWMARGLTQEEIEHKYNEDLHIHCYADGLRRNGDPDAEQKIAEFTRQIVRNRTWGR